MNIIDKQDYVLNFIEIKDGLSSKSLHEAIVYKHGITDEELSLILDNLVNGDYINYEQDAYSMSNKGLTFLEKTTFRKEIIVERRKRKWKVVRNVTYTILALMVLGISCH